MLGAGAGVETPNGSLELGAGAENPNGSAAAGAVLVFCGPLVAGRGFLSASIVLLAFSSHRFISSITVDIASMQG